jgi:hypothetical protein
MCRDGRIGTLVQVKVERVTGQLTCHRIVMMMKLARRRSREERPWKWVVEGPGTGEPGKD